MPDTPLMRLRLRQLRDLAAAFGIRIDKDGTKNDILPAMLAAERQGVFRQVQNADKALLIRAGWVADEGPFPREQIEALELKPEPAPREHIIGRGDGPAEPIVSHETPTTPRESRRGAALREWRDLQKKARDTFGPDFKLWGKTREELEEALRKAEEEGNAD